MQQPAPSARRVLRLRLLAILVSALLTACGGGGGGDGEKRDGPTNGPQVQRAALAGTTVELDAVELDPSIAAADTTTWRQTGGPAVAIADATAKTVSFRAPDVSLAEQLQLELEVARENGGTTRVPVELTVVNGAQVVPVPAADYQLETRPANNQCNAPPPPPEVSPVILERVYPGISVPALTDMDQAPGDDAFWYGTAIYDRKVYRFANDSSATELEVVLDLSGRGGKLHSMTFHPDFAVNGKAYFHLHNGIKRIGTGSVLEFTWSPGLDAFDPASERLILAVDSPHQDLTIGNHPGGQLNFGLDGYLYVSLGDNTRPGIFNEFSQDTDILWGSLLRIDVDGGTPYAIPPDNPFANGGGRPEIFAWGFRHPWKWNIDRATGEIWVGDVGLVTREEIDRVEIGGNYGWPLREGFGPCPNCELDMITIEVDPDDLLDPVLDYDRDTGRSVTGGYVYRGGDIPDLEGVYVFGDYVEGKVFALRPGAEPGGEPELLAQKDIGLVSFAEDNRGELYVLDLDQSGVFKLVANEDSGEGSFPALLSETGCVDMADPESVLPGMIPYTVQVPLWSDNAGKSRWMALPDGATIAQLPNSDGDLEFPAGTVLVKHFRLFNRLIETRLFMRHDDGQWAGYSYEWNDSQTEAHLLPGAKFRDVDGQQWRYPSRAECLQCHTRAAGRSLGPTVRQLNTYQSDGTNLFGQLHMLDNIGLFDFEPDHAAVFPALENTDTSVAARARAYLDVNCGGCHRPDGGGDRSTMDLRVTTPLAQMNACNAEPIVDTFGNPDAHLVAPGEPDNSILLSRMSRRDAYRMPPVGSGVVHPDGIALVREWILSLNSCD